MLSTWTCFFADYYLISVEVWGEPGHSSPFHLVFWTREIISQPSAACSTVSIWTFLTLTHLHVMIAALQILFWRNVFFLRTLHTHPKCFNLEIPYSRKLFPIVTIKIILNNVIRLFFLTVSLNCFLWVFVTHCNAYHDSSLGSTKLSDSQVITGYAWHPFTQKMGDRSHSLPTNSQHS